jgi:hypothetical protein
VEKSKDLPYPTATVVNVFNILAMANADIKVGDPHRFSREEGRSPINLRFR